MAVDVPDRGPVLVHSMIALIVLCDTAVLLRFASRKIAKSGFGYDDYMAVIAMLFANGNAICVLVAVSYDLGKHVKDARPDAVEKWHQVLYVYENFYAPAIATTKFSVLLFYNRIFSIPKFRTVLYILASTVAAWWIAMQFTVIFECTPIDFSWDQRGKGHCISLDKFFLGQAIPNIVTDIVLLSIPLPMIWNLQLPRSQKVALSGVFLLGGFVVFASIYRLVLLFKLSPTQPDITWTYFQVVLWSAVEPNVGVTSACLPSCRPIFKICIKSIVTLKESTFGTRSTQSKEKNNTGDHDFVRLVGTEGALHASHGIPLQEFGVRTKVTGNPPADRYESSIQSGEVHVRRDVEVQDG